MLKVVPLLAMPGGDTGGDTGAGAEDIGLNAESHDLDVIRRFVAAFNDPQMAKTGAVAADEIGDGELADAVGYMPPGRRTASHIYPPHHRSALEKLGAVLGKLPQSRKASAQSGRSEGVTEQNVAVSGKSKGSPKKTDGRPENTDGQKKADKPVGKPDEQKTTDEHVGKPNGAKNTNEPNEPDGAEKTDRPKKAGEHPKNTGEHEEKTGSSSKTEQKPDELRKTDASQRAESEKTDDATGEKRSTAHSSAIPGNVGDKSVGKSNDSTTQAVGHLRPDQAYRAESEKYVPRDPTERAPAVGPRNPGVASPGTMQQPEASTTPPIQTVPAIPSAASPGAASPGTMQGAGTPKIPSAEVPNGSGRPGDGSLPGVPVAQATENGPLLDRNPREAMVPLCFLVACGSLMARRRNFKDFHDFL